MRAFQCSLLVLAALGIFTNCHATDVNKIYSPYVETLEKEFEYNGFYFSGDDSQPSELRQKLAFGASIGDRWFVELGVVSEKESGRSLAIDEVELEAKVQLTEQGEFSADWGILFELERESDSGDLEATIGLLIEKEFGKTSLTNNVLLSYEEESSDVEFAYRGRWRYRYKPYLEPGLELHIGENETSIGPTALGTIRLSKYGTRKLGWQVGAFIELGNSSDREFDAAFSALLEYEFY